MASENETVAGIVKALRDDADIVLEEQHDEDRWTNLEASDIYRSLADQIEAAHKREMAAKDGERKGLIKANESLANDNTRLRGEIAELRECLSDAVRVVCSDCDDQDENGCSVCSIKCAEIKLRYDHGKYLDVSSYDRNEHPGAPELADEKAFTEAVMAQLQAALVCTRNAAVYLHEFEWWTSGDTGASDFLFSSREQVKGNDEDKGIV